MRNFKKKIEKNEKGITLVSLVITIIVLLILATVAINIAIDSNGLFARARKVAEDWNTSVGKEETALDEILQYADEVDGIKVEKVTDKEPGKLEEDGNTFTINSIEDLVFFAYDVTNGNNYEGKTVKLGLSLNFNSNKSYVDPYSTDYAKYGYNGKLKTMLTTGEGFKTIGTITNEEGYENKCFKGTFDGNFNKISNLKINFIGNNKDIQYNIGLFSINYGIIKNLQIKNANINVDSVNENYSCFGIISGENMNNCEISNCSVTGELNISSSYPYHVGNITAYNYGKIYNCYNKSNLNFQQNSEFGHGAGRIGGIVGTNTAGGEIQNVCNIGNISINFSKEAPEGLRDTIGGLIGENGGKIYNSYSVGEIKILGELNNLLIIGAGIGYISSDYINAEVKNCYFLANSLVMNKTDSVTINKYDTEKNLNDMKNSEFIDLLNTGNDISVWVEDINNINNGYPILNWQ